LKKVFFRKNLIHMNKLSNLFTATTILALIIFISCGPKDDGGGPDEPTEIEKRLELLLNGGDPFVAEAGGVKQDGVAATEWEDFTVEFTGSGNGGTFTTTGRPSTADVPNVDVVWPVEGTWQFGDSSTPGEKDPSKIVRSDGVSMVVSATSTKITLTFTIEDNSGGRTQGVTGTWIFEFDID